MGNDLHGCTIHDPLSHLLFCMPYITCNCLPILNQQPFMRHVRYLPIIYFHPLGCCILIHLIYLQCWCYSSTMRKSRRCYTQTNKVHKGVSCDLSLEIHEQKEREGTWKGTLQKKLSYHHDPYHIQGIRYVALGKTYGNSGLHAQGQMPSFCITCNRL
jgi:hypothetical protein